MRSMLCLLLMTIGLSGCASEFAGRYRALDGSWSVEEEAPPGEFAMRVVEEPEGLRVTLDSAERSASLLHRGRVQADGLQAGIDFGADGLELPTSAGNVEGYDYVPRLKQRLTLKGKWHLMVTVPESTHASEAQRKHEAYRLSFFPLEEQEGLAVFYVKRWRD